MTNKDKGDAFERRVREHYEMCGWLVIRAAGSLGKIDLVCIPPKNHKNQTWHLLQCKTNGYVKPVEITALKVIKIQHNVQIFIVSRERKTPFKLIFKIFFANGQIVEWQPEVVA